MKVIALSMLVAGAAAAELKLHVSTKTHVHAEYNGLAAEVKHLGDKAGISRIYDAETGESFLQVKNIDGKAKIQFFDHDPMEIENDKTRARKSTNVPKEYKEQFMEFNQHPKIGMLAQLSEEIGKTDAEHNVAFWVHSLALRHGKITAQEQLLLQANEAELESAGWWTRRRRRRRMRNISSGYINKCGNACFGQCGPGHASASSCECWSWVCGDCTSHRGCWEHDCHCSCDHVYDWWDCYTGQAHDDTCNSPGCAYWYCEQSAIDC